MALRMPFPFLLQPVCDTLGGVTVRLSLRSVILLGALALLSSGCSKKDSEPPGTVSPSPRHPGTAGKPGDAKQKPKVEEISPPETSTLDLGGGVKMVFVRIKAGKFEMGRQELPESRREELPELLREVTLTKDFWMQETLTTQAQWAAVMGENPSGFRGDDLPVERVSWGECRKFVEKLTEIANEQLKGRKAALPTEAEWEYACRAGSTGLWCFGDDERMLTEYAWFDTCSEQKTHPVKRKKPNSWGLYDMHGNVSEWCEDWFGDYPKRPRTDPTGPNSGYSRVLRGGSWHESAYSTRCAVRSGNEPSCRSTTVGMRAVLR